MGRYNPRIGGMARSSFFCRIQYCKNDQLSSFLMELLVIQSLYMGSIEITYGTWEDKNIFIIFINFTPYIPSVQTQHSSAIDNTIHLRSRFRQSLCKCRTGCLSRVCHRLAPVSGYLSFYFPIYSSDECRVKIP